MQEKHALLGVHNSGFRKSIEAYLEAKDYTTYAAASQDDLVAQARDKKYSLVIMDANFPNPGSLDISSLRVVYSELQQRITGKFCFIAFSGSDKVIEQARAERLPIVSKEGFNLSDYLK